MMLVRTYVAPSAVEGVGVFAGETIRKGQVIWRLDREFDRLISKQWLQTAPAHFKEFVDRYAYPLHDDPNTLVLETDNGRFMNHCEQPNTDFTKIVEGFATKRLSEGEEIFCNYNEFDPLHELLPSFFSASASRQMKAANSRQPISKRV